MGELQRVETVRFHGDELIAVQREDGGVYVPVKRMCEVLGLTEQSQITKLKDKAWASTTMVVAVLPDGRSYDMFALSLKSVPMWLATIDAGRVSEQAKEKLETYQRECADVLAAHFAPVPANDTQVLPPSPYDIAGQWLLRAGVKVGIVAAHVMSQLEANTGTNMDALRKALPSTTETVATLNATEVGKLLGLSAKATNTLLEAAGLQTKSGKDWALTEAGKEYGSAFPYERNGHTSYQVRWKPSVVAAVKVEG